MVGVPPGERSVALRHFATATHTSPEPPPWGKISSAVFGPFSTRLEITLFSRFRSHDSTQPHQPPSANELVTHPKRAYPTPTRLPPALAQIREAQIFQEIPGEIRLRVVKGNGYALAHEQRLLYETRMLVGSRTIVQIDYVERLPRSSSGKLRGVVSTIPGARIVEASVGGSERT